MRFFSPKIFIGAIFSFGLMGCDNPQSFEVPPTTDNFASAVTYNNKVDILFVIDNTDSMAKVRQNFYNSLPALVQSFKQLKMDYRIASTTTTIASWYCHSGRFMGQPKFIHGDSPNFEARLFEKIMANEPCPGNTAPSIVERGLDAVEKVLSKSYQQGEGAGFLRDEALLAIVYITNEDDKSARINSSATNGETTKYYRDFLNQLKPALTNGQRSWVFNFFGITGFDNTCDSGGVLSGYKEPGIHLMELANFSRGRIESICNVNLSASIANLRARIVQILTDFKLKQKPLVDTIRVFVNDAPVPRDDVFGWTYFAEGNFVRFNGASVPSADARIRVDFTPEGAN